MDGTLRVFDRTASALLQDALEGLCKPHKTLSPKWLYDQRGSELFEQITTLLEYYPTRTEARILRDHADLLSSLVPRGGALVEFGSGASVKTRTLLEDNNSDLEIEIGVLRDRLQQEGIRLDTKL